MGKADSVRPSVASCRFPVSPSILKVPGTPDEFGAKVRANELSEVCIVPVIDPGGSVNNVLPSGPSTVPEPSGAQVTCVPLLSTVMSSVPSGSILSGYCPVGPVVTPPGPIVIGATGVTMVPWNGPSSSTPLMVISLMLPDTVPAALFTVIGWLAKNWLPVIVASGKFGTGTRPGTGVRTE